MNSSERQKNIKKFLKPQPINHGQLDTFLIAVPITNSHVSSERLELLKENLKTQGSNLLNLVVRRSDAYEDEEYEVVYGADWLIAAKELELEKVWVWVFDMDDEQAAATKEEMEQLVGNLETRSEKKVEGKTDQSITEILNEKLQPIVSSINKLASAPSGNTSSIIVDRLEQIDSRINRLYSAIEGLSQKIEELAPPKINLLESTQEEIDDALLGIGVSDKQRRAALKAIEYWKASDRILTWSNLKLSTKTDTKEKIKDFGSSTYNKLRQIGKIF
ncbi:MAG: ParB N-terminal domain-containing protein [Trichocoleus desertorum ATA4-8-CV12]|jgi:ParB-like chromosome segregation protein Spo0J|nr:ParB N-terminal domain-containing protein [Trichocoleus desertorum ATA4-8-CV12]